MRYNNGKIYRITNNIDEMIYIGSTCLPLRKRFYCHKTEQHSGKGQNRRLFKHAESMAGRSSTSTYSRISRAMTSVSSAYARSSTASTCRSTSASTCTELTPQMRIGSLTTSRADRDT